MAKKSKKNRKKIQKRQRAKALKRERKKKFFKKTSPDLPVVLSSNPFTMGDSGLVSVMSPATAMLAFAKPLTEMANAKEPEEYNLVMALTQGFWNAFIMKDPQERQRILGTMKTLYNKLPWASRDFDELAEFMLKRHIYFMPNSHTDEERNRFSEEELKATVADEITSTLQADDYKIPEFDHHKIKLAMEEGEQDRLQKLYDFLKRSYDDIDLSDENDPDRDKLAEFQDRLIYLFNRYLKSYGVAESIIKYHYHNIDPLFNYFLWEYHGACIFNVNENHVEEYLMDFYLRKIFNSPNNQDLLPASLKAFFTFVETIGYIKNIDPILERIEVCKEDYNNMLNNYRN